jgi:hypothetical protein
MEDAREPEDFLDRGQFQRAAQLYYSRGQNDKGKTASLACAQDCLEQGLYNVAIDYFSYGGRADLAQLLDKILEKNTVTRHGVLHAVRDPVDSRFFVEPTYTYQEKEPYQSYTHGCRMGDRSMAMSVDDFVGSQRENFLKLVGYVKEQDYVGKAMGLKR